MKTLYDDKNLKAELDGTDIILTYKAVNKTTRIDATTNPKPVTDAKTIAALKQQGIEPTTRKMLGQVAVMPAEIAERIIAAAREDAEVQYELLRRERDRLAREIAYLVDEDHANHERAVEIASATGIGPKVKDMTVQIEAARAALAEFDTAHPEVKARIDAEKQEALERNMWN